MLCAFAISIRSESFSESDSINMEGMLDDETATGSIVFVFKVLLQGLTSGMSDAAAATGSIVILLRVLLQGPTSEQVSARNINGMPLVSSSAELPIGLLIGVGVLRSKAMADASGVFATCTGDA